MIYYNWEPLYFLEKIEALVQTNLGIFCKRYGTINSVGG